MAEPLRVNLRRIAKNLRWNLADHLLDDETRHRVYLAGMGDTARHQSRNKYRADRQQAATSSQTRPDHLSPPKVIVARRAWIRRRGTPPSKSDYRIF
jgi:hypothetical protein